MNAKLKKIYELFYSPVITPYNLLENIKLENYFYLNYYKNENNLVAEMKCKMHNSNDVNVFYYHFDSNDYLQKIYQEDEEKSEKILVYDRENEIEQEKKKLHNKKIVAS